MFFEVGKMLADSALVPCFRLFVHVVLETFPKWQNGASQTAVLLLFLIAQRSPTDPEVLEGEHLVAETMSAASQGQGWRP